MRRLNHALLLLAALLSPAQAQQYAGDKIPTQADIVPGAEIAFFRIADPTGRTNGLTLTNYYSMQDEVTPIDPNAVQRAIIMLHGLERRPGNYMVYTQIALRELGAADPNINRSSVAIITPWFANGHDRTRDNEHTSALFWRASKWSAGAGNHHPRAARGAVSSFDVLDQLVRFFDDRARFPQLKQIVVAGHSLGAQMVARYVQIGNEIPTRAPLLYAIANPNSWAWMDEKRPLAIPPDCREYDNWRAGFTNFTQYPMQYGRDLVARGRAAIRDRWNSRSKAFMVGLQDLDDALPEDCASHTIGGNHYERVMNLLSWFPPRCPNPHHGQCDTVDYVYSNHNAESMFKSPAGLARLFLDNFYGDGSKRHGYGPRQRPGDDPYPAGTP